ncbi:MAG TPA: putative baseplate assembly protein [Pyrinomonadaceae bacterium]|jgi:predicted phage baseplate assembly protein|nr:putative baseplate assembly protein [Pyrinomonadaceae bacterium]
MNSQENCRDKSARRRLIRERARDAGTNGPNGIDYVEVDETQRVITVYFLNKAPRDINASDVRIEGGVRVRPIRVTKITLCEVEDLDSDDCMEVEVDRPGDFSTYTLKLVGEDGGPLEGFDPRYAQVDFSFKANCPSEMDCAPASDCYKEPAPEPDIDYLAKDYASFRQLIFDRLSLVMPGWQERHVPDFGVAMVELFAYVGDYLSYYQDAVGTEAYLDTARLRVSVRRHALLVDYPMHEGCNARTWVAVRASGDVTVDYRDVTVDQPGGFYFITDPGRSLLTERPLTGDDLTGIVPASYEVFEPIPAPPRREPDHFYEAHNEIKFYTWRDTECCLPRGATSATLLDGWRESEPEETPQQQTPTQDALVKAPGVERAQKVYEEKPARGGAPVREPKPPQYERGPADRKLRLKVGDVLIFEEVRGPKTGNEADADKSHRHAVRLTSVEQDIDPLDGQPVVNVEWDAADALPFPLCITSVGEPPCCELVEDVSVARGNVVLADYGRTVGPEDMHAVPYSGGPRAVCEGPFEPSEVIQTAGRFRPVLRQGPVTHAAPFPSAQDSTRALDYFFGGLIRKVLGRVKRLRRQTEEGRTLTREELAELAAIFGRKALARAGFTMTSAREDRRQQQSAEEQSAALSQLVARFDDHMKKKARRVEGLRERALGGYALTDDEREEIAEMFGPVVAAEELELLDARSLGPASAAIRQDARASLASVGVCHVPSADDELRKHLGDERACWEPRRSLLESGPRERHFVAEMDDEGRAHLRFGDGENGRSPDPGEHLRATYRIGNGPSGNVGADSVRYVVFRNKFVGVGLTARNPLPARGGTEPESVADVKALAPGAVRKDLQRAVIAQDYATLAERGRPDKVQRAAANLNWAGSWYEMRTHVDPRGTEELAPALLSEIEGSLHRYRRIGHDLATAGARYVPLDVAVQVCVLPHYLRAHVRAALAEVFSTRALAGGRRGLFHPDNLTFGGSVFLSRLVAAAQSVEGVESVRVTRLQRLFEGPKDELESGVLSIGPLEVARLDNDPNFPEYGQLVLDLRGGR